MIVRPATEADLPHIRAIASSYGNLSSWPRRPDYLDHELKSATLRVCEVDGEVAGFGAVIERGGVAHLADLFVRPDQLGMGTGKALLNQLLPANGERVTFASNDPRAIPLYVRFGMSPIAPLLYLTARPHEVRRLEDPGVKLVESEPEALVGLDRTASGRERLQDLRFLQKEAGAHGFLLLSGRKLVHQTHEGRWWAEGSYTAIS